MNNSESEIEIFLLNKRALRDSNVFECFDS